MLSGNSGLPTGQSSFTKCSFMLQNEDGKRQNVCAAKVTKAASQNPILRQINPPWSWWWYRMSRQEMQDIYHSVYLLWRCLGSPSCGVSRRRRAIQDILSSLQAWVQRQTYSAETEGPSANGEKRVGTKPPQSYEAVLWAAHQKALETTEALCDNLERLDDERRERSWAHSQSRSWPSSHLRSHPRGQTWACSQSPPHTDSWDVHSPSPDGQPDRRVSFCKPGDECSVAEGENPSVEPTISNLEAWLEYQSTQIGTPMWWKELEAVPCM